ncbi:hypothetical protein VE23_00045 [Paenibacillus sp. D9]|nr:hypothetical protein VE23_00045 [Paenibacillus sp. D9]
MSGSIEVLWRGFDFEPVRSGAAGRIVQKRQRSPLKPDFLLGREWNPRNPASTAIGASFRLHSLNELPAAQPEFPTPEPVKATFPMHESFT